MSLVYGLVWLACACVTSWCVWKSSTWNDIKNYWWMHVSVIVNSAIAGAYFYHFITASE